MNNASPKIQVFKEGRLLNEFEIQGEVVLGRSSECGLRVDDRAISRKHAVIRATKEGVQVEKESPFGQLLVEGNDCTSAIIQNGKDFAIGPFLFVIQDLDKAGPLPAINESEIKTQQLGPQEIDQGLENLQAPASQDLGLDDEYGSLGAAAEEASLKPLDEGGQDLVDNLEGSIAQEDSGFEAPMPSNDFDSDQPASQVGFTDAEASEALGESQASDIGEPFGSEASSAQESLNAEPSSDGEMGVGFGPDADEGFNEEFRPSEDESESPESTQNIDSANKASKNLGQNSQSVSMVDEEAATRLIADQIRVYVRVLSGDAEPEELDINQDEIKIGRGKKCDIVINDKKVSRKAAIIRRSGADFYIKDLGSANGTYLNGNLISEEKLGGNDKIRIGDTELGFRMINKDYEQKQDQIISVQDDQSENFELVADSASQAAIQEPGLPLSDSQAMQADHLRDFESPGAGVTPADSVQPMDQFGEERILTNGFGQPVMRQPSSTVSPVQVTVQNYGAAPGGIPPQKPKKTLYQRTIGNDRIRKPIVYAIVAVAVAFFLYEEEMNNFLGIENPKPKIVKKKKEKAEVAKKDPKKKGPVSKNFAALSKEEKQFVENQYELGFQYFQNKEYDKSIFELEKIMKLVPDYKDTKDIIRYAKEGNRRLKAIQEEQRKKEEEERRKKRVAELTGQAQGLMDQKAYDQASELFPQILALDPENRTVAKWQREIDDYKEDLRIKAEEERIREEINRNARDILKQAESLAGEDKCLEAIDVFQNVIDLDANDATIADNAKRGLDNCRQAIKATLDPVLALAKQQEEAGELLKAYKNYEKATKIDPNNKAGFEGMERIIGFLRQKAKVLYAEAVIAESYSDFDYARKKFEEVQQVAPEGGLYYERAKRKLSRYKQFQDTEGSKDF